MFHITFVQISVFDWLLGRQKGSIFVKIIKNLLLRNHKEDDAFTYVDWQTGYTQSDCTSMSSQPGCSYNLSCVMRKQAFCIGENKGAAQLPGNSEADQRLCFRYTDSTIHLLRKSEISSL